MEEINLLLVDDEKEFVTTLAERLSFRGIRVRTAQDGEEALRLVAEEVPHVVVLDVMMPGLGGLEVLKRMKAQFPDLPVLLLTGHGSAGDGETGMRNGAFDYLIKPLDIDVLLVKIREAVKKPSQE
jgi:two-component system OmpR family response regulator